MEALIITDFHIYPTEMPCPHLIIAFVLSLRDNGRLLSIPLITVIRFFCHV